MMMLLTYISVTSACDSDEFMCAVTAGYKCISVTWLCDGGNDCGDWSDEVSYGK